MTYDALRKGRRSCARQIYFITTVTHNRIPFFNNVFSGRIIVQEMQRLHDSEQVKSLAWVIMPDHLHWLFQLGSSQDLSSLIKRLKGYTARNINQNLNRCGHVWQPAYYDHALRDNEDVRKIARYIVANPLRAGLAKHIGDYSLWDAVWVEDDNVLD